MSGGKNGTVTAGTPAEPTRRLREIEDPTNLWFVHPLAAALVPRLAAWNVHPNAVSITGMLCGVLAGVAYTQVQDWRWTLAGFLLMLAWHVMDGADGQLARLTHKQSHSGKVLDGVCDYVTFIAVYGGLALALSREYGGWVWGVVAASGLCHAVQSASYEMQREEFTFWGAGRDSAALSAFVAKKPHAPATGRPHRIADALYRPYVKLQLATAGSSPEFSRRMTGMLESHPGQIACIRRRYRETFAPALRRWATMSANYRTLGIFICALAGRPLAYFWFEIIGFSLLWLVLLSGQRARRRQFLRDLQPGGVQAPAVCLSDGSDETDAPPERGASATGPAR